MIEGFPAKTLQQNKGMIIEGFQLGWMTLPLGILNRHGVQTEPLDKYKLL